MKNNGQNIARFMNRCFGLNGTWSSAESLIGSEMCPCAYQQNQDSIIEIVWSKKNGLWFARVLRGKSDIVFSSISYRSPRRAIADLVSKATVFYDVSDSVIESFKSV